jgi:nitrogen regulatory protein P-II 2
MQRERATLVTIVTERILEPHLIKVVEEAGAPGYTITEARSGKGVHGQRNDPAIDQDNLQMIVVASSAVADAILAAVEQHYAKSYAIMAFTQTVESIRWTPALKEQHT